MALRVALTLAVAASVAMPSVAAADAPPDATGVTSTDTTSTSRTTSTSKTKSKSKSKSKSRKKSHKKSKKRTASKSKSKAKRSGKRLAGKSKNKTKREVSRTPSSSSLAQLGNMPRGYAWPPTRQMLATERACEAQLDAAGVRWTKAEPEGRIVSPVVVSDDTGAMTIGGVTYTSAYRKGPHKLDCQLAVTLATFAPSLLAAGVVEVKFGSIYRWTNVRSHGKNRNMLSRHALGIAMDIVSVTDASGRVVEVEADYPKGESMLLAIEAAVNDSGLFRTLLTPANDPISHHDHFHLEAKVDYTDRAFASAH